MREVSEIYIVKMCTPISGLIITITVSSNVIGTLAALIFINQSIELLLDNVIWQLAVIGHL